MSSLGAAAHGAVQARAEALGITTTEYFQAGGAAGVHGLSVFEIRARAHDVRRRAGLSAATERGLTTGRTMQVPAPIGERDRKRYKERERKRE